MANHIDDASIEYVGILAKLELSGEEIVQAKKDMESMLDYVDKLNELDTSSVEPMSHVFPVKNVFREDVVTNGDGSEDTLKTAPEAQANRLRQSKVMYMDMSLTMKKVHKREPKKYRKESMTGLTQDH